MKTKTLNDQIYGVRMAAASRGHALKGKPRCICGFKASSPAELDDHLYNGAQSEQKES